MTVRTVMMADELTRLEEQVLYRKDIMRLFNISNVTVWQWVKDGNLREHKFGRTPIYLRDEVLADLKKCGKQ